MPAQRGRRWRQPPVLPSSFSFSGLKVNGAYNGFSYVNVNAQPVIKISFSAAVNPNSTAGSITFNSKTGAAVNYTTAYENHDSTMVITPSALQAITQYTVGRFNKLKSSAGGACKMPVTRATNDSRRYHQQISVDN